MLKFRVRYRLDYVGNFFTSTYPSFAWAIVSTVCQMPIVSINSILLDTFLTSIRRGAEGTVMSDISAPSKVVWGLEELQEADLIQKERESPIEPHSLMPYERRDYDIMSNRKDISRKR